VALDDLADGQPDRAGVVEGAALHARSDRCELGLGGGKQRLALARALGGDERVAADDQPLAGELIGGDLGQVDLVKAGRRLQWSVPRPLALARTVPGRSLVLDV
jgi:hypothetical protein